VQGERPGRSAFPAVDGRGYDGVVESEVQNVTESSHFSHRRETSFSTNSTWCISTPAILEGSAQQEAPDLRGKQIDVQSRLGDTISEGA
jgi:hypothetical protein